MINLLPFIASFRQAISSRRSARAAVFANTVEHKFNDLAETHVAFHNILRLLATRLLRIKSDWRSTTGQDSPQSLVELFAIATELRSERQAERRVAFEEAKRIAASDDIFLGGIVRTLTAEEEASIRTFMMAFVGYFTDANGTSYSHDLGGAMQPLQLTAEIVIRSGRFNAARLPGLIATFQEAEKSLDRRWGKVAEAYAEVKYKLIPAADLHLLSKYSASTPITSGKNHSLSAKKS